jgi:hypothetical protein
MQLLLQPGGGPALVGEPFLLTGFIRLPAPPSSASAIPSPSSTTTSNTTAAGTNTLGPGTGTAGSISLVAAGAAGSQVVPATSRNNATPGGGGGGSAAVGGLPSCVLEFAVRPLPPPALPGQQPPGATLGPQQQGLLTPGDVMVIVDDRVGHTFPGHTKSHYVTCCSGQTHT